MVHGCCFIGAQDDCINIHGTYLILDEIVSEKQMKLRFAHHQTYGMKAYQCVASWSALRMSRQSGMVSDSLYSLL